MAAAFAQRGGSGVSLCLASAGVVKMLSVAAFTLMWTHSVEKVDWQEDGASRREGWNWCRRASKAAVRAWSLRRKRD